MLNIALFGPPGSGKGTQSKLILEKYGLTYIATGDILRQEIAEASELGLNAKAVIDRGGLVEDEIIVQIIEKRIDTDNNAHGILFDGFPRTTVQCYILEGLLMKMNASLNCMISLEVPEEELRRRMLERAKQSGRSDDTEEVINKRLEEYREKTLPVMDFYAERGKLHRLDGTGSVEEIFERIDHVIKATLKQRLMHFVLLGMPGCGKGTQGVRLAERYNLCYISTGKILRREEKNNTLIGQQARLYLEQGSIVPDALAIQIIEREIMAHPNTKGYIFKGFPRTIVQAYILDGFLMNKNTEVTACIKLETPTLESVKRLAARSLTDKCRKYDKTTESIVFRLEEYQKRTSLVEKYYKNKGKLYTINGVGSEDEVFETLCRQIDEIMKRLS
ncbi:MAG: adenylate kinase [Bacteroidales bacterium]|jgi:adenylate kinase|nr:adenylate kinase [Bacteroidales bacterium]